MKKYVAVLLAAIVFAIPAVPTVQAATTDAERRETISMLERMIVLLRADIAKLEAQLEKSPKVAKPKKEKKATKRSTRSSDDNDNDSMPEIDIIKLQYEQDDNTVYLRTNSKVEAKDVSIKGHKLESVYEKEMPSTSCVGAGKQKKCGGFVIRLKVSPQLEAGNHEMEIENGGSVKLRVN